MNSHVYTIDEIKTKIMPIAKKHRIPSVYLFGSYARGDATPDSDIDFIVDTKDTDIRSILDFGCLVSDFENVFGESQVDIVTLSSVSNPVNSKPSIRFASYANREKVRLI